MLWMPCGSPVSGVASVTCYHIYGRHRHPGNGRTTVTCALKVSGIGIPSLETCALMVTFASMVTGAPMASGVVTVTSSGMATDCQSGLGHHHGASPGSSH